MYLRNILLALGAFFVLAGIGLLVAWMGQRSAGPVITESPPVVRPATLAAARAIPAGTLLRKEDLYWKEVGPGEVGPGVVLRGQASEEDFYGAVNRRDLKEGEPLIVSEIVKSNDRRFLAAVLKPGERAISIAVDATQSVAGLILPGDRVDVILIQSFAENLNNWGRRAVSETVLRDARVIAIDQSLGQQPDPAAAARGPVGSDARIPKTITLALPEQKAEALMVALQLGKIQLAVRPLEQTGVALEQRASPVWASDVSPALDQMDKRAGAQPAVAPGVVAGARKCSGDDSVTGSTLECLIRRPPATRGGVSAPRITAPITLQGGSR